MRLAPGAAALVLAGLAAAALLTTRVVTAAVLASALLAVVLRAPARRRWPYLVGGFATSLGVFLLSPLLAVHGSDVLWSGPTVPVLGVIDVTSEEIAAAALSAARLAAVAFAFAAYALLLDHDRLLSTLSGARRSAFIAALAIRLMPTLERDAIGLSEAMRGRGLAVSGVRARGRLVSPLVGGSLERALNLAESMEVRGFGQPGRTRVPTPRWRVRDWVAAALAVALATGAALWL
ncbi:MAG: energy-coupling factor transporter transmembrane component T [Gaiellales bacterium]